MRFGESDIEAIDGFDGRLSFADADVMLTVTVTDPKGNTFEALENAPYVPTEKGVYKAEYTVVNKTDAPVKAVRYIHVSGAVLRIAVHKDILTSAYVGSRRNGICWRHHSRYRSRNCGTVFRRGNDHGSCGIGR